MNPLIVFEAKNNQASRTGEDKTLNIAHNSIW